MLQAITKSDANQSSNCYRSHSLELFKSARIPKFYTLPFCEACYPKWVNLKVTVVKLVIFGWGLQLSGVSPKFGEVMDFHQVSIN